MSKPRSQRMQRVTDLAERRTDEAANAMAAKLQALEAAKRQLEELRQFRRDYAQAPGQAAVSVAELLNRQQFVARIDQAIIQQQREIEGCTRHVAQARIAWLESRSRSVALDTVTQRYRSREVAREERAEQAAVDERAQRPNRPWQPS